MRHFSILTDGSSQIKLQPLLYDMTNAAVFAASDEGSDELFRFFTESKQHFEIKISTLHINITGRKRPVNCRIPSPFHLH